MVDLAEQYGRYAYRRITRDDIDSRTVSGGFHWAWHTAPYPLVQQCGIHCPGRAGPPDAGKHPMTTPFALT